MTYNYPFQKVKGKHLTKLGELYGIKRKWFGLEPDFLFRERLISKLKMR